jgi:anti-sigma regulatory factor (Ser/Thr protein kinase)
MPDPTPNDVIRALLRSRGSFQSGELVERTGLTRQALSHHLARALEEGWLVREGGGRSTRYRAASYGEFDRTYATRGLEEDAVASELLAWLDEREVERTKQADGVLSYAVSEMVNNAIDHSGSEGVRVLARAAAGRLHIAIEDAGLGALENLRLRLHLEDHLHALQELSKGKVTTAPEEHSGEGLFFTSKAATRFRLVANGWGWFVDNELRDATVEEHPTLAGTRIELELDAASTLPLEQVFAPYTHDFRFDTTRCTLRLFEYGTSFLSRSEAKRLTTDLDRFDEVILDFHGVERVGQAFVDQVFRVWATQHPRVRLLPERMSRAVEFMVRRGLAGDGAGGSG